MITLNGSWNYIPPGLEFAFNVVITLFIEIVVIILVYGQLEKHNYSHDAKEGFLILAIVFSNIITALVGWLFINAI